MANTERAVLTVAAVRARDGRPTEVLFNERQRVFVLDEKSEARAALLKQLQSTVRKEAPVKVSLDLDRGTVQAVEVASAKELEEFTANRILLEKPEKPVAVTVSKIDPTIFNFVDVHQKWKHFRLCTRIIPSYAKAKEIFDYCAGLSCHLPGPPATPPCIPFQYVRDGCYARAHQMRRIITTKYRYCCEKVFSFANNDRDVLSVKADKWGGCCVTWWYHVAPLVRVRLRLRLPRRAPLDLTLAMVIDPGMFDKPVLLSTWLAAQENTTCDARANVTMYSIQPGSAYWPANRAGTAFGTDPNYTQTLQTLQNYANLTTC